MTPIHGVWNWVIMIGGLLIIFPILLLGILCAWEYLFDRALRSLKIKIAFLEYVRDNMRKRWWGKP